MSDLLLNLLKERVNPVVLASGSKGGEYHSPCPGCGGKDRFLCFPEQKAGEVATEAGLTGTWSCPRGCGKHGDIIDFLKEFDGLSFGDACERLGIRRKDGARHGLSYKHVARPDVKAEDRAFEPKAYSAPADIWCDAAGKLVAEAHERLLGTPAILKWLGGRGLPLEAVKRYRLGYIEGEDKSGTCIYRARSAFGLLPKERENGTATRALWIPRGVTIPAFIDGRVGRVRIRRRNADLQGDAAKYALIPQASNPYSAPLVLEPAEADASVWVVVESELDAMAVHHACGGAIGCVSVLTVTGKPDAVAHKRLRNAARILLALDFDDPKADGSTPASRALAWWTATYPQAVLWTVPDGKDPGDAFAKGVDLRMWIAAGMPSDTAARRLMGMGRRRGDADAGTESPADRSVAEDRTEAQGAVTGAGDPQITARPSDVAFAEAISPEDVVEGLRKTFGDDVHIVGIERRKAPADGLADGLDIPPYLDVQSIPRAVLKLARAWRTVPVTLVLSRDANGVLSGWRWACSHEWAKGHGAELIAFYREWESSTSVVLWLDRHKVFTNINAKNFLRING